MSNNKEMYLVEFQCFCCFTNVKKLVSGRAAVKKVYCDDERCVREYAEKIKSKHSAYRIEYLRCLREVQSRVPLRGEEKFQKIFRRKGNRLFEDEVCRGLITELNKDWVVVQAVLGGAKHIYRREQCFF